MDKVSDQLKELEQRINEKFENMSHLVNSVMEKAQGTSKKSE